MYYFDYRVEIMTGIPDPAVGGSPFNVPENSEPVINEETNNEVGNIWVTLNNN